MGWLGKLLGAVLKYEPKGIRLDTHKPFWTLEGETDFPQLLRALVGFLPDGSILYFEDGSPSGRHLRFFKVHAIPEQIRVAAATLWLQPRCYHVPATSKNLAELAELAESCAEPELAVHFHVYSNGKVLLEWHDAFANPMLISGDISEGTIHDFSKTLGMHYALESLAKSTRELGPTGDN